MSGEAPSTVREATSLLFARYLARLEAAGLSGGDETSTENLAWMCRTAMAGADTLPLDKLSRWLGFVQGVMAARGQLSVPEEREVSRPLFHAAYAAEGILRPPTLQRP